MVTGVMAKGTEERTVANRGRFDKLSVNNANSAGNEHYAARRDELAEESCYISGPGPLRKWGFSTPCKAPRL